MSELKRSLNLAMLVFYGTGMILGAGIYSIIGKAAVPAGETLWLSFLVAAVVVTLTALSYAELASMFPKAGAEFVYLAEAFPRHRWLGFTTGVAVVFAGAATAATVAIAFSNYLREFFPLPELSIAVTLLTVFTILALVGIRASTWANVVFTLVEASGLLVIIYLGFSSERFGDAMCATPHLGTLTGSALVVFSFFGFENIVNLADEAKQPIRDIPRAILLSLFISSALYLLVSFAALALADHHELSATEAPLMMIANKTSRSCGVALGIIALFSTANTALISMIGASRLLFGIAKTGALPAALTRVSRTSQSPWVASILIFVVAISFLPLGKIEVLASISSFATMFAYAAVNCAVIRLRYSKPDLARPFRLPGTVGRLPLVAAFGLVTAAIFLTQFEGIVYVIGGGFIAVIVALFQMTDKKAGT